MVDPFDWLLARVPAQNNKLNSERALSESDRRSRDFYNRSARIYDLQLLIASLLQGVWEPAERRRFVTGLNLKPGQRVIEVAVGTGSNSTRIAKRIGPMGRLIGLDISSAMLRRCQRKFRRLGRKADLIEADASQLAVADNTFDVVLHFGGIKDFGDKKKALGEMIRVASHGGKIIVSEKCVPPDKRHSILNRLLLRRDPLLAQQPPVDLIPSTAMDVKLSWFWSDTAYSISFTKP